ncbi:PilN domain-containing protein [Methylobacter sp. BlB1]|uniref:PilN domain-containing protein n=1 Tax=unclassified Methylobacter TaxID=2635283 RepID=UPI0018942DFD|nr:PilN domain-containing protein [Methylobacter sp. BlB1]MBF6647159.1 PilN domain-containing protein [Methylobacter sp. BlB1]
MTKINLLPWREELRKQKKQDFINVIVLSVLLTIAVLGLVHFYIEGLKEYQERRNKMLQDEIALLDKKIQEIKDIEEKKSKLLAKIDVIQRLQESRPEIVHLFDEIARTTPEGVFLTKFTQTASDLTFDGKSQSNARVSAFMRAIDISPWLQMPKLDVIQSKDKTNSEQLSDFTMHAKQGKQKAEDVNGEVTNESVRH